METVGHLKFDIGKNGGFELKIGQLSFEYEGGESDIDIKLEDDLIAYVPSGTSDDTALKDVELSVMGDIKRGKEALREERKATKLMEEAEKIRQESILAVGKVEAYEKLLIGRDITISK